MVGAESVGVNLLPIWGQGLDLDAGPGPRVDHVRYAARRERPVLDLKLLKVAPAPIRPAAPCCDERGRVSLSAASAAAGRPGLEPLQAGLLTMSTAVGSMSARMGAQFVLRRFGFRNT